jgi:hypothetical protein
MCVDDQDRPIRSQSLLIPDPRLTKFQIRVREHVDMIRSCEPGFKRRVVVRARRAEIQIREAEAIDSPGQLPSSLPGPVLHQCIQNACQTHCSNDLIISLEPARTTLPKSLGVPAMSASSS